MTRPLRYFITGTAGFIGFHLARRLIAEGHEVAGYDAMTEYYDPVLKRDRLRLLMETNRFHQTTAPLEQMDVLTRAVEEARPDVIVHLAAQAGVRYSIENPRAYVDSNLVGTFNLIEIARHQKPAHLLLASTSSVYGANPDMPFAETDKADWPLTLYAATKKATEGMSHSYAHLFGVPTTCFRFFTVYGPWGRPDMALFKFVDAARHGRPIEVYGNGQMRRDFTYVDDLVEGILRLSALPPAPGQVADPTVEDTLSPVAPWRVVNIAGGTPVDLTEFIDVIEEALGRPIARVMLPMQPGDVTATFADHRLLEALTGFRPGTSVREGVKAFVDWYTARYADA